MSTPRSTWNERVDVDAMEASFEDRFSTSEDVLCKGKNKEDGISNDIRKENMIHVKESICRWAYECGIPFHVFEKDSFKMLAEVVGQFGPKVQPPTRYELEDTFLGKEVERTKNLLKRHEEEWKLNGCSIIPNVCSNGGRSILNLCVNSKLGTVFLSSKESLDEAHTSEHIFEYVDSCIEEVGPENVVQIVTEHASNNIGAAKLLKAKRPTIFWTSCASHNVNLMLEAIGGLPRYKEILDQAKKLTVFIYAHHKTLTLMRHFTKKMDILRPGVTKFASAFLTLQSLAEKKYQLRHMFSSEEWEKCKFSNTVKGKSAYETVISSSFWVGVSLCLKVFAPLVKVLRMVNMDSKPSMGFIYGELKKAKQDIINALSNNKKAYEPIMDIILTNMKDRLDTCLHLTAYLLNPFYLYNNLEVRHDIDAIDAFVDFVGILFPEDYDMQNQILMVELPMYKDKRGNFYRDVDVNNEKFDPSNWWEIYGSSTPHLRKIATRILSLNTSSLGCERNWSTVHTKKRNRLEPTKLKNLVFVHCNANLMEKNKKGKIRGHEVLLANDASEAQDWIVDDNVNEVEAGLPRETVCEAMSVDEHLRPRTIAASRELFEEEFESESEEEVDEDVEYESDGVQIVEQYGEDEDETSI